MIGIPSGFLINPLLDDGSTVVNKGVYFGLLSNFKVKFPETNRADADHAWLTPVKGFSDNIAINSLVYQGVVDEQFVTDMLAIDFENPVLSQKRCSLLKGWYRYSDLKKRR